MNPPNSAFACFDSIELDPAHAPTRDALEHALELCAPEPELSDAPGFYLLDDSGGRFKIDRECGIVSVKDDNLLACEAGAVHAVRLRVIELSGASYQLRLRLRLTGPIPQMVGGEENDCLFGHSAAPATPRTPPSPAWACYAAAHGAHGKAPLAGSDGAFGGLLVAPSLPALVANEAALLLADALPAPSAAAASWSH